MASTWKIGALNFCSQTSSRLSSIKGVSEAFVEVREGAGVMDGLGLSVTVGVPAESGKGSVEDRTVRVAGNSSRIGEVVGYSEAVGKVEIGIEVSVWVKVGLERNAPVGGT